MGDWSELIAENERLQRFVQEYSKSLDQLKAENEALRKDAERYRWLRAQPTCYMHTEGWQIRHHWKTVSATEAGRPNGLNTMCVNGEDLDGLLDTRMSEDKGQ